MRFPKISNQNSSSSLNQITPLFSCQPNRTNNNTCLPKESSDSSETSLSSKTSSDHHHHGVEDQTKEISSGRERLKRHREEVAGRVLVPEKWGKEELMKDWIDYSSFDKLLVPNGIRSAREALMVDSAGRRRTLAQAASTSSPPLRIDRRCC